MMVDAKSARLKKKKKVGTGYAAELLCGFFGTTRSDT